MVETAPRGAIALAQKRLLEVGRTDDLGFAFEADIDTALGWWFEVERSPLLPAINALSGTDVVPHHHDYIRRLATYRRANASPLDDPELNRQMLENARQRDPQVADEMAQATAEQRRAIEEILNKYAP